MTAARIFAAAAVAAALGTAPAAEGPFKPGEGAFDWDDYAAFAAAHDLSGTDLSVTGPWTGAEKAQAEIMFDYFEAATGATVRYSGSDSFEQDIVISARAGSPPNIAIFPQPGLAADMAAQGHLAPLPDGTAEWIARNYAAGPSWVELGSFDGPDGQSRLFGMVYRADVKSLVWYVPDAFAEMGYEVPASMEELKALTRRMVEDGQTPWCIGLGAGAATGWPATDWVEDLMLRTQPAEVYDAWVANEIPFDDPRVIAAIEEFGWFARTDAHVEGGTGAVANTDYRESPAGLFAIPPGCYMHRQASFIPTFFPDGVEIGRDADFFYFPAYAGNDLGAPVLGSGSLVAITDPSPAATAFIEWLKTPIAHELLMAQGSYVTPHKDADPAVYASDSARKLSDVLRGATTFRFDASDLMPGEIGADAFWSGMVDYVTGAEAAEVAGRIQDRWDAIR